jgi:Asp-tRNA(Asn)/Glu-tRNA(Gln) amidotransferase A subunit family amidase
MKSVLIVVLAVVVGALIIANQPEDLEFPHDRPVYDVKSFEIPELSGFALRMFAKALHIWPVNRFLVGNIRKNSEFPLVRQFIARPEMRDIDPTFAPYSAPPSAQVEEAAQLATTSGIEYVVSGDKDSTAATSSSSSSSSFQYTSAADIVQAYRDGTTTPTTVTKRVFDNIKASNALSPPLLAFMALDTKRALAAAAASTARYQAGSPLSYLDGVPFGIKLEFDVEGFPTTMGTSFINHPPAPADCEVAHRLVQQGAILIGQTSMHECGVGVTGINPNGAARNPYNTSHVTGGSSSGSGSAVGSGLVPLSIGADGGGSIRIPAALCGAFGLKPTANRMPSRGEAPLAWSVAVAGPITSNARDLAVAYLSMAGPDETEPMTTGQPMPHAAFFHDTSDLEGLRIGVFHEWNADASAEVRSTVAGFVKQLQAAGAEVVPIVIPNLHVITRAHAMTITSEMATALLQYPNNQHDFNPDTQSIVAIGAQVSSVEYIGSQKIRTFLMETLDDIFQDIDAIVTPATGIVAPYFRPEAEESGIADSDSLSSIIRFMAICNFAGIPGITFPIAYTSQSPVLPISAQAMASHWREDVLLRIANFADKNILQKPNGRSKPQVHFSPLA